MPLRTVTCRGQAKSLSKGCFPTSVALRPPRHGSFLGNLLKNMPFKWRGHIKPALSKLRAGYNGLGYVRPTHYRDLADVIARLPVTR